MPRPPAPNTSTPIDTGASPLAHSNRTANAFLGPRRLPRITLDDSTNQTNTRPLPPPARPSAAAPAVMPSVPLSPVEFRETPHRSHPESEIAPVQPGLSQASGSSLPSPAPTDGQSPCDLSRRACSPAPASTNQHACSRTESIGDVSAQHQLPTPVLGMANLELTPGVSAVQPTASSTQTISRELSIQEERTSGAAQGDHRSNGPVNQETTDGALSNVNADSNLLSQAGQSPDLPPATEAGLSRFAVVTSNNGSAPSPQPAALNPIVQARVTPSFRYTSYIAALQAATDDLALLPGGDLSTENARILLLKEACSVEDGFFIALHQLFCIWSLEPTTVHGFLRTLTADRIDTSFGVLQFILRGNQFIQQPLLRWFSVFPLPLSRMASVYEGFLPQVSLFMVQLASLWATATKMVVARGYPLLLDELVGILHCYSPTMQMVMYTSSRRRMEIPGEAWVPIMEEIFREDQAKHRTADGRFFSLLTQLKNLEAFNEETINKYRQIAVQAKQLARQKTGASAVENEQVAPQIQGQTVSVQGQAFQPRPPTLAATSIHGPQRQQPHTRDSSASSPRIAGAMTASPRQAYIPVAQAQQQIQPRQQVQQIVLPHQMQQQQQAQQGMQRQQMQQQQQYRHHWIIHQQQPQQQQKQHPMLQQQMPQLQMLQQQMLHRQQQQQPQRIQQVQLQLQQREQHGQTQSLQSQQLPTTPQVTSAFVVPSTQGSTIPTFPMPTTAINMTHRVTAHPQQWQQMQLHSPRAQAPIVGSTLPCSVPASPIVNGGQVPASRQIQELHAQLEQQAAQLRATKQRIQQAELEQQATLQQQLQTTASPQLQLQTAVRTQEADFRQQEVQREAALPQPQSQRQRQQPQRRPGFPIVASQVNAFRAPSASAQQPGVSPSHPSPTSRWAQQIPVQLSQSITSASAQLATTAVNSGGVIAQPRHVPQMATVLQRQSPNRPSQPAQLAGQKDARAEAGSWPSSSIFPAPGVRIYRHDQPHDPNDRRAHAIALHQTLLRSPQRQVVDAETMEALQPNTVLESYYQSVQRIVLGPITIAPRTQVHTYEFMVTKKEHTLLPLDSSPDDAETPIERHFNGSLRYRLRCCAADEDREVTESDFVVKNTTWPDSIFINFNNEPMSIRSRVHNGKDLPVELTHRVRVGTNTLQVVIPKFGQAKTKQYLLGVEVVETASHSRLLERIEEQALQPADVTAKKIMDRLTATGIGDEEVVLSEELSVDLADVFIPKIFLIPVRGAQCKHIECFDLFNWLNSRPRPRPSCRHQAACSCAAPERLNMIPTLPDKWRCPICSEDARPCSLVIDGFLLSVRTKLEKVGLLDRAKSILVAKDGKWRPVVEEPDADDGAEDDNDAEEPRQKIAKPDLYATAATASRRPSRPVEVINLDD